MSSIYLDYNASTPIDPRVTAVMRSLLDGPYANPSAIHAGGHEARAVIDRARAHDEAGRKGGHRVLAAGVVGETKADPGGRHGATGRAVDRRGRSAGPVVGRMCLGPAGVGRVSQPPACALATLQGPAVVA